MTREEAIEYWEGLHKTFYSQLEKEENHFGRMHLQTTIEVLDTTISALRTQQQPNAPMTLDELRQMDGEPIWVVIPALSDPYITAALVMVSAESVILTTNNGVQTEFHSDAELEEYEITIYRNKPECGAHAD